MGILFFKKSTYKLIVNELIIYLATIHHSPNPAQLPGNEIKMICFLNGHPNEELDEMGTVNKCVLTQDLKNFWNSIISTEEGNVSNRAQIAK